MDDFTKRHLTSWVEREFGPDNDALVAAMTETYLEDPETYERAGWWRCHDDMIAAGRHTL